MMKASIATLILVLFVAGCGGSGGGGNTDEDAVDREGFDLIDQHNELFDRIDAVRWTETSNLPTGSVTYTGSVFVEAFATDGFYDLVGESNLDVNFAGNSVSGGWSDFQRVLENGDIAAYDGNVELSNGSMSTLGSFTFFDVDYEGTLTGEGNALTLSGEMQGSFHGENGEAVLGRNIGSINDDMVNGESASVLIEFAAEQ